MRTNHTSDQHGEYGLTCAKEARWSEAELHNTHAGLGASVVQLTFTDRSHDRAVIMKPWGLYSFKARDDLNPVRCLKFEGKMALRRSNRGVKDPFLSKRKIKIFTL